jgi:hypothetical protein
MTPHIAGTHDQRLNPQTLAYRVARRSNGRLYRLARPEAATRSGRQLVEGISAVEFAGLETFKESPAIY